jgi:hypothetical protein
MRIEVRLVMKGKYHVPKAVILFYENGKLVKRIGYFDTKEEANQYIYVNGVNNI